MSSDRKLLIILTSAAASIGGTIFGLTLAWSAPVALEIIENENFKFYVSAKAFGWIAGIMALGGFFAAPMVGCARSVLGTKNTIIMFCTPIFVGQVFIIFASDISMLIIGRFLNGVSISCFAILCPIYVGEIAPNEIRGALLSFFQVNLNLGILLIFIVGYFFNMSTINVMCAVIPIAFAIIFFFLPESQKFIKKNCEEKTLNELVQLQKYSTDLETEIDNETKFKSAITFKDLLNDRATVKATIIILMLFMFLQMSGQNVVLYYATTIFQEARVNIDAGLSSLIISLIGVLAILLATFFVDKFGRKVLLIASFLLAFLGLIGIGTFFKLKELDVDTSKIEWLPLVSLCIFMFAFNFGIAPVTFTLLGEIFKQEAKNYVAPMGLMVNFFLSFTLGFTFPLIVDAISLGFTFYIFSIFTFFGTIFSIFYVPETNGRSFDEILKLLK